MGTHKEIERAKVAAVVGDRSTAQQILKEIITHEPQNVEAWLALADVMQKPKNVEKILQRVLKIDPGNQTARQKLAELENPLAESGYPSMTAGIQVEATSDRKLPGAQTDAALEDPWQGTSGITAALNSNSVEVSKPSVKEPAREETGKPRKSVHWLEALLVVILVISAICVAVLFFVIPKQSAVQGGENSPADENVTSVIYENIRADNAESLSRYMATIHSKSPSYETTRTMTKQSFSLFDLSYKISGVRVTRQNENEAVVAFTLTTRKIRGPNFRDNRIDGEMMLRKQEGRWKIYDQDVHNIKYFN